MPPGGLLPSGACARKRTVKRAPPSGDSPTSIVAPWWRACWATSARPRPEPGALAAVGARERLEDPLAVGLWDAGPVVVDAQDRTRPSSVTRDVVAVGAAVARPRSRRGCRRAAAGPAPSRDATPASSGSAARSVAPRVRARDACVERRRDELGEVDVACSTGWRRRAPAPAGRRAGRRAGAARRARRRAIACAARRRQVRDGGPAPTASPGRSSAACAARGPASAAKRRVAASARSRSRAERPSRASIALKLARERAQLGRAVVVGHAAVEVLVAGDPRRRPRAAARSGAQHERRRRTTTPQPPRPAARSAPSAASRRLSARLPALDGARRLETTSSRARPPRLGSRSVVT